MELEADGRAAELRQDAQALARRARARAWQPSSVGCMMNSVECTSAYTGFDNCQLADKK